MATIYAKHFNNPQKGRAILETLLKTVPMPQLPANVIDTLLSIYRQQNLLKPAVALVDEAIRTRPTETVWLRHKVDLAIEDGNPGAIRVPHH